MEKRLIGSRNEWIDNILDQRAHLMKTFSFQTATHQSASNGNCNPISSSQA